MIDESKRQITIPVLKIMQPVGEIYVGSMRSDQLVDIALFDVRRIARDDGIDHYLGIQRELNVQRVKTIRQYVTGPDASFPTSIVLAVDEQCVTFTQPCPEHPEFLHMTLSNYGDLGDSSDTQVTMYRSIARVIDGQHRIAGLFNYNGPLFELNVSLFVGADLADQAAVFGRSILHRLR